MQHACPMRAPTLCDCQAVGKRHVNGTFSMLVQSRVHALETLVSCQWARTGPHVHLNEDFMLLRRCSQHDCQSASSARILRHCSRARSFPFMPQKHCHTISRLRTHMHRLCCYTHSCVSSPVSFPVSMSSRPPNIFSALPPVSAVRLHAQPRVRAAIRSACDDSLPDAYAPWHPLDTISFPGSLAVGRHSALVQVQLPDLSSSRSISNAAIALA